MTKYISTHAAAAKMIRAHIKSLGIKATVKASSYSMGSSVRAEVTDINPNTRKELESFVDQFQYGQFDGMADYYEVSNSRDDIPQVKYTFLEVHYSDELSQKAYEWFRSNYSGVNANTDYKNVSHCDTTEYGSLIRKTVYRILTGAEHGSEEFWSTVQG